MSRPYIKNTKPGTCPFAVACPKPCSYSQKTLTSSLNSREELMCATSGNHVLLVQCRQKTTSLCEKLRTRSRVLKDQRKKSTTFWINSTPFAKKSSVFTGKSTTNAAEVDHKLEFPTCKTHQAKRKKASSAWLHAKNYLLLSYDNLILSSYQSHWQWKSLMLMSKLSTARLTSH